MNRIWYWHTVFATLFIYRTHFCFTNIPSSIWSWKPGLKGGRGGLSQKCWLKGDGKKRTLFAEEPNHLLDPSALPHTSVKVDVWKYQSESVKVKVWKWKCDTLFAEEPNHLVQHLLDPSELSHYILHSSHCKSIKVKVKVSKWKWKYDIFISWGDKPLVLPFCNLLVLTVQSIKMWMWN